MTSRDAKLIAASLLAVMLCYESPAAVQERPAAPSLPTAAPAPDPAPSPAPAVRVAPIPELSAFTPELVTALRRIRASNERRQDDVFMKVGDSSTVSRGFLTCFARADEIELAGRDALQPTIDFFRRGNAGGRDPFRRESLAAAEGWSARHVLSGSPPPLLAELRATQARFAFVMNGGNDVEARDDYQYATRMLRIVELLVGNGVIPILSSLPPRADEPSANVWVSRYNLVTWGIARALSLPYLDYHQVMARLPRQGLAGDGVHPNALLEDGRARACDFTERGLAYGHNTRNLLALRGLDHLRRTVVDEEPAPDPARAPLVGAGTVADPFVVRELPFADRRDTRTDGSASIDAYPGCGAEQDESGRELVYRVVLDRPLRVRFMAVGRRETDVDVHLLGATADGVACLQRDDRVLEADLSPGTYHLVVDTFAPGGEELAGEVLVLLDAVDGSQDGGGGD